MPTTHLQRRQQRYFKGSSAIAQLDNEQIGALLENSELRTGWGSNQRVEIGGVPLFVKRVPMTHLEHAHPFSTQNLYELPTFYNYGFGSAGLGVFRELVAHIKTTNWVLAGEIASFPLLYHYRILPAGGKRDVVDMERHARTVAYWGGSESVGRYLLDRASATHELVLFLEHIPHTAAPWLLDHPDQMNKMLAEMHTAVTFLRQHGMLHLDAHLYNMLTDGQHAYLSDFGLVLDRQFNLTAVERQFYTQHRDFDYGYLLWNLGAHLVAMYRVLPEGEKTAVATHCGILADGKFEDTLPPLLENRHTLAVNGLMPLRSHYLTKLDQYHAVIIFMHTFYTAMRRNDRKDTPLQHTRLRRLLKESGFI